MDHDTTARSEAAVQELKLQMAEAAGPISTEATWAVLLSFATLLMTDDQLKRFGRFAMTVLKKAEA
jgi:hypothetical protein